MGMPIEREIAKALAAQVGAHAHVERFAVIDLKHQIVGDMTYATRQEAEQIRFGLRRALPSAGPLGVGRVRERIVRDVEAVGLIN